MNNASDSCKTSIFSPLTPLDRNLERSIQNPVPSHQTNEVYSVAVPQGSLGPKVLNQHRSWLLSIPYKDRSLISLTIFSGVYSVLLCFIIQGRPQKAMTTKA